MFPANRFNSIKKPSLIELALAAILIYMLSNNIQSLLNYRNGLKRLEEKTQAINNLKSQNDALRAQIANTQTDEFLQKAAIDQLNLSKPGETILILDNEENTSQSKPTAEPENLANKLTNEKTITNLALWRKAFNL